MSGSWQPTTTTEGDSVTTRAAQAWHDLLDRPGRAPGAGDPLPPLWHWAAFAPRFRLAELAADGHPPTGGFLPPTGGRRRMYAGGTVTTTGVLRVGERLTRVSAVTDVTEKQGRTGELLFVTVDHALSVGAALDPVSVREQTTLVYRGAAMAADRPAERRADPLDHADQPDGVEEWPLARTVPIDPVLLFGFSALTGNAHRIHYDRDYATTVEGYPGLVVHGPLQALLLADLVERTLPGYNVTDFTFRSLAPAFDNHPLELRGRHHPTGRVELAALTRNGIRSMTATATVRPSSATPSSAPPPEESDD